MLDAQVPYQCALPVPGKISGEIRERHRLVGNLAKSGVTDDVWSKPIRSEIYEAGDFDQRRRVKCHVRERATETQSIKKTFQIQAAAHLKICAVALPTPLGTARKTAHAVTPFAVCDLEALVVPFSHRRQVPNFVIAAL